MIRTSSQRAFGLALLLTSLAMTPPQPAAACTRAVYFGKEGQTVTGRTMDWAEDMQTNLWIFPRGMARDGGLGKASLTWTSKYGSVVAVGLRRSARSTA